MSLDRFKRTMQPQLAASCGEFGIDELSLVELKHKEIICRGVVRWIGPLPHLLPDMIMAGIELVCTKCRIYIPYTHVYIQWS